MNRSANNPWWLALTVTFGVTIIPGAAQALPSFYQYYSGDFGVGATMTYKGILAESGAGLSRWTQDGFDGNPRQAAYSTGTSVSGGLLRVVNGQYDNTLRSFDEKGTTYTSLPYGDAGVFHLDEGNPIMDGPALVAPRGQNFEYEGRYMDAGEPDPAGAVPEPETLVLVGLGLLGVAGLARAQG